MGQVFEIAAPRIRRRLDAWGKMSEILCDGPFQRIVDHLIVPERPALPIQTPVPKATTVRVAAPIRLDSLKRKKTSSSFEPKAPRTPKHTVFSLPLEIIRHIFACTEAIDDILAFGMAFDGLWPIAKEELDGYYMSLYGTLANHHIVCLGEYSDGSDYPPGLFSETEVHELVNSKFIDHIILEDVKWDDDASVLEESFQPFHFTFEEIAEDVKDVDLDEQAAKLWKTGNHSQYSLRRFVVDEKTYVPRDEPWILRNWTTKEFVRAETIALRPEYIDGPYIRHVGFGEALTSRICWTSYTSEPIELYRGPWAGHRFDIVTLARHNRETQHEQWADVGEKVRADMETFWGIHGITLHKMVSKGHSE